MAPRAHCRFEKSSTALLMSYSPPLHKIYGLRPVAGGCTRKLLSPVTKLWMTTHHKRHLFHIHVSWEGGDVKYWKRRQRRAEHLLFGNENLMPQYLSTIWLTWRKGGAWSHQRQHRIHQLGLFYWGRCVTSPPLRKYIRPPCPHALRGCDGDGALLVLISLLRQGHVLKASGVEQWGSTQGVQSTTPANSKLTNTLSCADGQVCGGRIWKIHWRGLTRV